MKEANPPDEGEITLRAVFGVLLAGTQATILEKVAKETAAFVLDDPPCSTEEIDAELAMYYAGAGHSEVESSESTSFEDSVLLLVRRQYPLLLGELAEQYGVPSGPGEAPSLHFTGPRSLRPTLFDNKLGKGEYIPMPWQWIYGYDLPQFGFHNLVIPRRLRRAGVWHQWVELY